MERSRLVFLLALVACTKTEPAELDRQDLKAAFAMDAPLDRALKQAEDETKAGHDDAAADILKITAGPAANVAVDSANAVAARSTWGQNEKKSLVAIETDRRDEVARYESALRGTDLDDKLKAIEKQLELEKRVIAISAEIERGP